MSLSYIVTPFCRFYCKKRKETNCRGNKKQANKSLCYDLAGNSKLHYRISFSLLLLPRFSGRKAMPRSAVRSCSDFHWAFIGEYQFSCKHAIHFASRAVSNPQPKRARFHRRQLQQLPLCSFSRCKAHRDKTGPSPGLARLGSEVAEWSSFLARPGGWGRLDCLPIINQCVPKLFCQLR